MDEEVEIILQQDSVEVTEPLVADYILPTATANTLGGVKIGDNINIDSTGHISVPTAGSSTAGVIKVGTGLTIDANGVLSSDISNLPQATKNTLGVVYVDDELNTLSQNPVQNAVVSLEMAEIDGTVSGLSTTVTNLGTTVTNLGTSVTNLNTSLGTLSDTVTNQGNTISTIEGNITTIQDDIDDINDDITGLGNGMAQYQGYVDPLLVSNEEIFEYTDLDTPADFTAGNLTVYRRGRTGIINFYLEANLTLASNTPYNLCQVSVDNTPTYESYGILLTDDGEISVTITSAGYIILQNLSATSKTITKITGNLPVVFN
jgi:hypothetical protein